MRCNSNAIWIQLESWRYIESDKICRRIGTLGGRWPSSFKPKNQRKLGLTSGTKRFPQMMRKRPKQKQESTEVGIDFWYEKFPRMMRKRPKQKQESTEVGIDFWYEKFPRMMRKRPKQKQACNVRLRRSKNLWHMNLFDCIRSQSSQQFVNSFRCMKSVSQEAHLFCGCPLLISSTELPTAIQERLGEQWSESLLSNVELRQ